MQKFTDTDVTKIMHPFLRKRSICKKGAADNDNVLAAHHIRSQVADTDAVTLSSHQLHTSIIDTQFSSLCHTIATCEDELKYHFKQLLFPLFVHIHFELRHYADRATAARFFSQHGSTVYDMSCAQAQDLLVEMERALGHEDSDAFPPEITRMRSCKYKISMPRPVLQKLTRLIHARDVYKLTSLMNEHIAFEVSSLDGAEVEASVNTVTASVEKSAAEPQGQCRWGCSAPSVEQRSEARRLRHRTQHLLRRLNSENRCTSTVLNWSLSSARVTACRFSHDLSLLALAVDDNSVLLYKLTADTTDSSPTPNNPLAPTNPPAPLRLNTPLVLENNSRVGSDTRVPDTSSTHNYTSHIARLRGHSDLITDVRFSTCDKYLFSSSLDRSVRLWRLETGENIVCYRGHQGPVLALAHCTINDRFVSCSADLTLRLWTTERVHPIRTFSGHILPATCACFHPNGQYVASASTEGSVRLWDTGSGSCVRILTDAKSHCYCLVFTSNGKQLAAAGDDGCVRMWELDSGQLTRQIVAHNKSVYSLSFKGDLLASAGHDDYIRMWSTKVKRKQEEDISLDVQTVDDAVLCTQARGSVMATAFHSTGVLYTAGCE